MKKNLLVTALALASILPLGPACAANYYVVVPLHKTQSPQPTINVALSAYTLPAAVVGTAYSGFDFKSVLQVAGDPNYAGSGLSFSVVGTLPAGLSLDASTGVLSGTATVAGTSSFQVKASYRTASGQQAYQVVTFTIQVTLAASNPPQAFVGQAYNYDLKPLLSVTGDDAYTGSGVTWAVVSNTLPAGLYLTTDGRISGTPTAAGTGSVTARATYKNVNGQQVYQVVVNQLTVALAAATPPSPVVGAAYSYNFSSLLSVNGGAYAGGGVTWSVVSGALPAGLGLNSSTGVLSGTPTTPGTSSFTLQATYSGQNGQKSYQVVVDQLSVSLAAASGYAANFGYVFVNGSQMERFQYQNTGTVSLSGISGVVTGSAFATVTATTCNGSLAPSATCTFDVTYHPTAVDTLAAQLLVSNAQQASAATLNLSGQSNNVLYSAGNPTTPLFIKTASGTGGTYLGTQTSTTQLPQITAGYLGGASANYGTPKAAQQVFLQSTTATTATYLLGLRDIVGSAPYYTKMVQVVITLSGNKAYATVSAARYNSTDLVTGSSTNILTLWNTGSTQTVAQTSTDVGYGAAGLTVIGF